MGRAASCKPYTFSKGPTEQVRLSVHEYKGKPFFSMRVYYEGDDGEYRPTKKGVTVSAELLPHVLAGVRDQVEKAIKGQILEKEEVEAHLE